MLKKFLSLLFLLLIFINTNICHAKENPPIYTKSFLLGKYNPATQKNFIKISNKYTSKKNIFLNKTSYKAFIKMYTAARADGVKLKIVSATRNFYTQKLIWEAKWSGQRLVHGKNLAKTIHDPIERARTILLYSSMPGTSRHHWGTDIDLNNLNDSYFLSGTGAKIYKWLQNNAHRFGFYQVYTPKPPRPWGYEEEKWHWSYLPLSQEILKQYQQKITLKDINSFQGYDTAHELDIINKYVLGINPQILQ